MSAILRAGIYGRCLAFKQPFALQQGMLVRATSTVGSTEPFFEKQKALNRPLSPHLSIYKPQMTSMLSLSHRTTGICLSAGVYSIAIGALFMKGHFPECVAAIQAAHISQAIIIPAKLLTSGAFFYHYFNGIRHLLWDLGIGFKISELYTTGKIVIGLAVLSSLYATFGL